MKPWAHKILAAATIRKAGAGVVKCWLTSIINTESCVRESKSCLGVFADGKRCKTQSIIESVVLSRKFQDAYRCRVLT